MCEQWLALCTSTKQTLHAATLNNAFSSSFPIGDGVALCATTTPVKSWPAHTGEYLHLPISELNEGSAENANIDIATFTDFRNILIQARGQKLIVPRQLMYTASRLIDTPLRPFTMNNDINAMRETNTMPQGYFVYDYPDILNHLVRQDRRAGWTEDLRAPTDGARRRS